MNDVELSLLKEIADIDGTSSLTGAYNIRKNGQGVERKINDNINIVTKEDKIDPGVGVVLKKKIGDDVRVGDVLCTLYLKEGSRPVLLDVEIASRISDTTRACWGRTTGSVSSTMHLIQFTASVS